MFFEGSEKKIEVVVDASAGSLREKAAGFWENIVKASKAQILSKISNEYCDAYLLSESSLFVWEDRFTMITCGQTTLVSAAQEFFKSTPKSLINSLIYERKNEYFPHLQHSDFYQDLEILHKEISGKAYRFGNADEHHVYLFHQDKDFEPKPNDTTIEILMYDLQGKAKDIFRSEGMTSEEIRAELSVDKILPDFVVDDFVFKPYGYSLNALNGSSYYTIHVTPQELGSYVSFETNMPSADSYKKLTERVLEIFKPKSFDVVNFQSAQTAEVEVASYSRRSRVEQELSCGYGVNYSHFFQACDKTQQAYEILEK